MTIELNTPFSFQPRANLFCAGQPDAAGFREAAAQGVAAVLNLRPDAEMDWDEAGLVTQLGLDYKQIPIAGPGDINEPNAKVLNEWLDQFEGKPVLVHCASSNRVGALLALGASLRGASDEDALELGRAAGLTKMEPLVQMLLQQRG